MLCLRNTEDVDQTREKDYKYVALGNSDAKYPIKFVISGEKQENLKAELLESFNNLQGNQRKVRIFFKEMRYFRNLIKQITLIVIVVKKSNT